MIKKNLSKIVLLIISLILVGWGGVGHRIINKKSTESFPSELNFLLYWADSLAAHASDADYRKDWDPTESNKHYIDIDNYPEFISTGRIIHNFDSLLLQHGYTFVMDQGILPWAIMKTVDSLTAAFAQHNWQKAMLIASDLGHYIGDCHMPLHVTRNYNGQYTNQYGIHSRYESSMISTYQQQIIYSGDTINYVSNISNFIFDLVYANYKYVDSVLQADLAAKNYAGGTSSTLYYQKLWELTKVFTVKLFKNASYNLARLIFTAWKNAGEPIITNVKEEYVLLDGFKLEQNYPNPFNPSTKIRYTVPSVGTSSIKFVQLKVYDVLGNEVATLVKEEKSPGLHEITWNAVDLPSGLYFYQLRSGKLMEVKKMVLLK
jgi:hypothetical protein